MLDAGVVIEYKKEGRKPLLGLTFVFTGALKNMGREEARKKVESLGGKTVSSVSKKIDYVVLGEEAGSKVDKARSLDLKIISEEEFLSLIQKS
jgi:DNA ligase (NAD+)